MRVIAKANPETRYVILATLSGQTRIGYPARGGADEFPLVRRQERDGYGHGTVPYVSGCPSIRGALKLFSEMFWLR